MGALQDLRKLAGIPDQDEVVGRIGHGDQIGQRDLASLVDKEVVERTLKFIPRKQPCRSSDDIGGIDCGGLVAGHTGDGP